MADRFDEMARELRDSMRNRIPTESGLPLLAAALRHIDAQARDEENAACVGFLKFAPHASHDIVTIADELAARRKEKVAQDLKQQT